MADVAPLNDAEVKEFVEKVYVELFDTHAPLEEFLPYLDDEGLEMRFPEETVHGHQGFQHWYERVINTFFDEVHTVKEVDVSIDGDQAKVNVAVNWQTRTWTPPAAKSQWLGFDAGQRWVVKRSPVTGEPMIVTYIVDTFVPMQGSTSL